MTGVFNDSILSGQTALVTGASRGIGAAIAAALLAAAGAKVVGTATTEAGALPRSMRRSGSPEPGTCWTCSRRTPWLICCSR